MNLTDFKPLEEALHEASLEPSRWPGALRDVARFVTGGADGTLAALTFLDPRDASLGWILHGAEEGDARPVLFDVRGRHALFANSRSLPENYVGPSEAFASPRDLADTSLARAWLADDGSVRGVSAILSMGPTLVAALHVLARGTLDAWSDGAAERVRSVIAPMRRALEVYLRLRQSRERAAIDRALIDMVDVAALVIDERLATQRMNKAALALIARADGLTLEDNTLRAVKPHSDCALRTAITSAFADAEPSTRVVSLARANGRRPMLAFVSPLTQRSSRGAPTVALLVRDTSGHGPHADELLRQLFGLTPTEARLAFALSEGQTIEEVASSLGRSRETIRTHLKHLFEKTATTRQAEVVRLVLAELPSVTASE